jgi:hypothetical protein
MKTFYTIVGGKYERYVPLSALVGETLARIEGGKGEAELLLWTAGGTGFAMFHDQDCCESVSIEDIAGDLSDLIGTPILEAYESTSADRPGDVPEPEYPPESQTWTFYRLVTIKGTVVIRWLGESNGYYSEGVSVRRIAAAE